MDAFLESLSLEKDIDVALVAAGGYGMLISDYLYTKMNISVMYIGGALQLFLESLENDGLPIRIFLH